MRTRTVEWCIIRLATKFKVRLARVFNFSGIILMGWDDPPIKMGWFDGPLRQPSLC